MKQRGFSALAVAAVYIGTVVGAGFATGQEIVQFFSRFGAAGMMGIMLAAVLFAAFGFIIMDLGKRLRARSYKTVIRHAGGRIVGVFIDALITFFLFGALATMLAGTGALFAQQFRLPALFGSLSMAALAAITVLAGFRGVVRAVGFAVFFLLLAMITTSAVTMLTSSPDLSFCPAPSEGLAQSWILSALLYVSYNTVMSVSVLGPLGGQAQNNKAIRLGAALGGAGLGAGCMFILLAMAGKPAAVAGAEVPMARIAGELSPALQYVYALALLAGIYTTAAGVLFGLAARLNECKALRGKGRGIVLAAAAGAVLASRAGFVKLVQNPVSPGGVCGPGAAHSAGRTLWQKTKRRPCAGCCMEKAASAEKGRIRRPFHKLRISPLIAQGQYTCSTLITSPPTTVT